MRIFTPFFILSTFISTSIFAESNTQKSILIKDNNSMYKENTGQNHVDFFDLSKKYQNKYYDQPAWDASETINMSSYDKFNYLNNHHNYSALEAENNAQLLKALQKESNYKNMRRQQFRQEQNFYKMKNSQQKSNPLEYSVP